MHPKREALGWSPGRSLSQHPPPPPHRKILMVQSSTGPIEKHTLLVSYAHKQTCPGLPGEERRRHAVRWSRQDRDKPTWWSQQKGARGQCLPEWVKGAHPQGEGDLGGGVGLSSRPRELEISTSSFPHRPRDWAQSWHERQAQDIR